MAKQQIDYESSQAAVERWEHRVGQLLHWGGAGAITAVVTLFLAFLSMGAGHGHYSFARIFFPYSMLLTLYCNDTITAPLILLAIAQFPIYSLLLGLSYISNHKAFISVTAGLALCHIATAIACFTGILPNFS